MKKGTGEEYFLPGVHSDVGGSYNKASELDLKKDIDDDKKIYMLPSDEGLQIKEGYKTGNQMVINEDVDQKRLNQDRDDLIAQGWYHENEIKVIEKRASSGIDGDQTEYALTVRRQGIRSAYCNIPLKIMAKYARKPDVKLKINSELENVADRILRDEPDLKDLEGIIDKYIAANKNKSAPTDWKPEDWKPDEQVGEKAEIDRDILKAIRHRHFHFSASKWSTGYKPHFIWDEVAWKFKRIREYYDA